jgi:hypothetical protein
MRAAGLCTIFCLLLFQQASAKVRNGYARDIDGGRQSLKNLRLLLETDRSISIFQRMSINTKIEKLKTYITYYELTEKLLDQFRMISPDLYFEMDLIQDHAGRYQDVYVRFLPEEKMPRGVSATTSLGQLPNDAHGYFSEYGPYTVSVKIVAGRKSLSLLAHEFGHVKHQVPHLATYMLLYSKYYLEYPTSGHSLGHRDDDPSGQSAKRYALRFRNNYVAFVKANDRRIPSHLVLLQGIQVTLNIE